MADSEIKEIIAKKTARFKDKLQIKDLQLDVLLEITNAINANLSTMEVLEKYQRFVRENLKIEKLALFAKYKKWRCLLEYGIEEGKIDALDVDKDCIDMKEITSVTTVENKNLEIFDMVVPVYHGDSPLAYLLLGDIDDDTTGMSAIIKHLNFLQLLTNIVVSAIENQRLAKEALKQEREKQKLIEKQKEMLEVQVAERTNELRKEKEQSEHLLHNILPKSVADELKNEGITTPQHYNEASILFTDFKDFTKTSSNISPDFLVGELNDIFKAFDQIMDKYGIEKIKTIGDSYMAACGLPMEFNLHALQCVRAAMDMLWYLQERGKKAEINWRMRVGIHSGPLVAGVVGTKKFTYDIWGDTVNTAARMESNGEPGKINASASTHKLIEDYYNCEYRGKMEAKGKGEIDMYFVTGEKGGEDFLQLKKSMIAKLNKGLSPSLSYHNTGHTLDVYYSATNLGIKEKLNKEDLELLKVATLFHDSGFIKQVEEHEKIGCEFARDILPKYKYNEKQIEKICGMIMATKIPQAPTNHLEKIICDADLDYFGREDFFPIASTLFEELNNQGEELDEEKWNNIQLRFIENHKYFTKTAKKLRQETKLIHLEKIKALVAAV